MNTRNILFANPKYPNLNGWQDRHNAAIIAPVGAERPIVRMFEAWVDYAERHQQRYESPIGEDGVLGDYWQQIGEALRGLLNGETGRLDCGTLDTVVLNTMSANGVDVSQL